MSEIYRFYTTINTVSYVTVFAGLGREATAATHVTVSASSRIQATTHGTTSASLVSALPHPKSQRAWQSHVPVAELYELFDELDLNIARTASRLRLPCATESASHCNQSLRTWPM